MHTQQPSVPIEHTEIEAKFFPICPQTIHEKLVQANAHYKYRYFEHNTLFDTPTTDLYNEGALLRLRTQHFATQRTAVLTFKEKNTPPHSNNETTTTLDLNQSVPQTITSPFKICKEYETLLTNPDTMCIILNKLGFVAQCEYEKQREEWLLSQCTVCIDRLPFSHEFEWIVEIEGTQANIINVRTMLGLSHEQQSSASYHTIHTLWQETYCQPKQRSFVFTPQQKKALLQQASST